MKKVSASAIGKVVDWKVFETEKGKKFTHLQMKSENGEVSCVMVSEAMYKRSGAILKKAYEQGDEVAIHGRMEDLGAQVRLVAEAVSIDP